MSTTTKKYDAVIAGYTCVDMVPEFIRNEGNDIIPDLLKPGKLIEIGKLDIILGGAVPNTGLLMKHFGNSVFLNGLTGEDSIGQVAKEYFKQYGIADGVTQTDQASTAYSIVIAPQGIDRIFLESPGCNQVFGLEYIDFDSVTQSRLFHFGYPPLLRQFYLDEGRQLIEMYQKVHEMGVLTSLDFSLPDPESESGKVDWTLIMQKVLPYVDIFVPSLEELIQIIMPQKYSELQATCINSDFEENVSLELVRELGLKVIGMGVKILLVKMGKRGIYLHTGKIESLSQKSGTVLSPEDWNNKEIFCKAYPADITRIKNASGAGDTAIAAFLSAILKSFKPEKSIKYASLAGRDSLYSENIFESMSSWDDLTHEMNAETNELISLEQ